MSGTFNNSNFSRQRMINLMYLVFIAMMAFSISPPVNKNLDSIENNSEQKIYDEITYNPTHHAKVIPDNLFAMQGVPYTGQIILSVVDSVNPVSIFMNGKELPIDHKGFYSIPTPEAGSFTMEGYIKNPQTKEKYFFQKDYFISERTAYIQTNRMNVLYAGIENELEITVPGTFPENILVTMTNGVIKKMKNRWYATPSVQSSESILSIKMKTKDGEVIQIQESPFRIKKLPDPVGYIVCTDTNNHNKKFKGGLMTKQSLSEIQELFAGLEDEYLDMPYTVLGFELTSFDSFGNTLVEKSNGKYFSKRQKEHIKKLSRGKRFFITRILTQGPDSIERYIPPIELIIQ